MFQKKEEKGVFKKLPFFISYFISDPTLKHSISSIFKKYNPTFVCFRDKVNQNIKQSAKTFLKIAKENRIDFVMINNNLDLALELNFDGVHLTSKQFDKIEEAKKYSLLVLISCHTQKEIELAYKLGADGVTYSPIFFKENKSEPKGIEDLKNIVKLYQKENFIIIAFGGIIINAISLLVIIPPNAIIIKFSF
jgi:thiamine-phosphate pyrophosphorylase